MNTRRQQCAWKRYIKLCEDLDYDPDDTEDITLLQKYKSFYHKYCQDNNIDIDQNKELDEYAQIGRLSQLLYLELCYELGYESIIKLRRELSEFSVDICNKMEPERLKYIFDIGSRAEGLRIETSDGDRMVLVNDTKEMAHIKSFHMERSCDRPGYVLLRAEINNHNDLLNGIPYISSARGHLIPNFGNQANIFVNGPCTTIEYGGGESDLAYCLRCPELPCEITFWKERCEGCIWPSKDLVEKCVSLGCQLAPVGANGSPKKEFEWRISFVLMEKELIFSLSHVQFMCYGLLKIFHNEVGKAYEAYKDIISSYILKTILFWEIHESINTNWSAKTILCNFRRCIARLLTWVKKENCPNFFIPENNMFADKMKDQQREELQSTLEKILGEKYCGLYRCCSIDIPYLVFQTLINEKENLNESLEEIDHVSKNEKEYYTWDELSSNFHLFFFHGNHLNALQNVLTTLTSVRDQDNISDLQKDALETWISETNVYIASHQLKKLATENDPSKRLEIYNACSEIFRTNDHHRSVALLHLATMMFITGRYKECLEAFMERKKRFVQEFYLTKATQIQELGLEFETTWQKEKVGIQFLYFVVSTRMYACMLCVISLHRLGFTTVTEVAFRLLQKLYYEEIPIKESFSVKETSLHILGICAEAIGKRDEAYHYYLKALKNRKFLLTDKSCILRILCLLYKCYVC